MFFLCFMFFLFLGVCPQCYSVLYSVLKKWLVTMVEIVCHHKECNINALWNGSPCSMTNHHSDIPASSSSSSSSSCSGLWGSFKSMEAAFLFLLCNFDGTDEINRNKTKLLLLFVWPIFLTNCLHSFHPLDLLLTPTFARAHTKQALQVFCCLLVPLCHHDKIMSKSALFLPQF